jgi:iron complex outermembrane receptor protein
MMKKLTTLNLAITPGKPPLKLLTAAIIATMATGSPLQAAEDLGIIQVESTTIDDRFESKRKEASNIAVVSGEEIDQAHTENIQQVLQGIPGITTELQSGDSLKIHIRGIENQRFMGEKPGVAVVIDGVPVFERTGKVNIDLDNIESIKVIKGGASYLFGDDALSGAVIITTKRGAKYDGLKVNAETGSFGYRKAVARAGFAGEEFNGHLQISRRQADGYYDDSNYKTDYINGKLQYYIDDVSDLTFGLERSKREKDSHGSVTGVTAARLDPKSTSNAYNDYARGFEVDLEKYFVTYSRDIGEHGNLLLNAYRFSDDTAFISAPTKADPDLYTYDNDYHQVQQGIKAEWRSGGEKLAWMGAVDLRDNLYENKVTYNIPYSLPYPPFTSYSPGDLKDDDSTEEQVYALYGEMKFKVSDPLTMTLNGRYDRIELDYTDNNPGWSDPSGSRNFDITSWRLGGNYAVSDNLDWYANIATGFRAPNVEQLFTGDYNTSGVTQANPDLDPEQAVNLELGLRTKADLLGMPLDIDLAVFQINRKDFIMSTSGQYTGPSTDVVSIFDNIGGVRNRGLELAVAADISKRWSWNLAYTYIDAEFTEYDAYNLMTCGFSPAPGVCASWDGTTYDNTGNTVPRVPKHHLNLSLNYHPNSSWTFSAEMDTQSSYYADELNWFKIDGRTVFNVLANYDLKQGDNTWSFFARVDNLLGEDYYNTARGFYDSNYDGAFTDEDLSIVVNQGRTFTAGISATF